MKKLKNGALILLVVSAIFFAGCSSSTGSSGGTDGNETGTGTVQTGSPGSGQSGSGGENPPVVTYIGSKAPTQAKEVGDIVFNDGSAMPYTDFAALNDDVKNTKKTSAIALIFYKGTGLNSDTFTINDDGELNVTASDTTTVRTLGVGLKHTDEPDLRWCTWNNSVKANAYSLKITTIQCTPSGNVGALTFKGDKNGSDNLEQIADFLTAANINNDTGSDENYPAFYFAKNYKTEKIWGETVSRITAGSEFETGWYLPCIAELFQIYACREDLTNGFDIDAASYALGGKQFNEEYYWSSTQRDSNDTGIYLLDFGNGGISLNGKSSNSSHSHSLCAIREFN